VKKNEPEKPNSNEFRRFFGFFYEVVADLRLFLKINLFSKRKKSKIDLIVVKK
jgi:hypothetical protein